LGLDLPPVLRGDWTSTSGYRVGVELAKREGLTAVFCANDQMALGVIHAFAEAGIRVPRDASVIGFDDIPEAEHFLPPLTTVRQDFVALGHRIMSGVERLLAGDGFDVEVERPTLVVRSSTAPPRV
jgi:DNA-binding LacI/PurR family transcriptional regulator